MGIIMNNNIKYEKEEAPKETLCKMYPVANPSEGTSLWSNGWRVHIVLVSKGFSFSNIKYSCPFSFLFTSDYREPAHFLLPLFPRGSSSFPSFRQPLATLRSLRKGQGTPWKREGKDSPEKWEVKVGFICNILNGHTNFQ